MTRKVDLKRGKNGNGLERPQRFSFEKTITKTKQNMFIHPPVFQVVCVVICKERSAVQLKGKDLINILNNLFDSKLEI